MKPIFLLGLLCYFASTALAAPPTLLNWDPLPPVPDDLGFAGPFVGVHNDALIVAGGANFPVPVWENDKVWHDGVHVLIKNADGYAWKDGGKLPGAIAYGSAVS
ncbi:MAG: sodium:solute symporter, partial [Planctomycetota bacterium]